MEKFLCNETSGTNQGINLFAMRKADLNMRPSDHTSSMHKTSLNHLTNLVKAKQSTGNPPHSSEIENEDDPNFQSIGNYFSKQIPFVHTEINKQIRIHKWRGIHYIKPPFKQAEFITNQPDFFKPLVKLARNLAQDLQVLNISDVDCAFKKYMKFIKFMNQVASSLRNLNTLYLDLSSNTLEMPDEAPDYLRFNLAPLLTHLQTVILRFFGPQEITDKQLRNLSKMLLQFPKLEKFSLTILDSTLITDEGFGVLITSIARYLPKLNHLSLYFAGCEGISDESLRTISQKLPKISHSLRSFTLDLSYCCNITDAGLEAISQFLSQNLKNLENIFLGFAECEDLTNKGFEALGFALREHLPNLKNCVLDFSKCHKITPGTRLILTKSFEKLARLSLL